MTIAEAVSAARTDQLIKLAVKTGRPMDQIEAETRGLSVQALRKWDGNPSSLPMYKKSKVVE